MYIVKYGKYDDVRRKKVKCPTCKTVYILEGEDYSFCNEEYYKTFDWHGMCYKSIYIGDWISWKCPYCNTTYYTLIKKKGAWLKKLWYKIKGF
jgi:uncharacterized Zn-finger protein